MQKWVDTKGILINLLMGLEFDKCVMKKKDMIIIGELQSWIGFIEDHLSISTTQSLVFCIIKNLAFWHLTVTVFKNQIITTSQTDC